MDEQLLRFDKSKRLCFFDFETYNLCLNFINNKPWQTAIIDIKDDAVIGKYDIHIKWPNPPRMSEQSAKVTRFEPAILNAKGVPPEKGFEILYNSLESADKIIGHNVLGFDMYLVRDWYILNGKPWRHLLDKVIDTHCVAKGIKLGVKYNANHSSFIAYQYKLLHRIERGVKTRTEVLGKEFGIEHDYAKLHDAMVDIELLVKIWKNLRQLIEI